MTLSERAEQKYKDDPEEQKKQAEEALDNPISEYFANKHPEVVKTAQERHYLTDQVWNTTSTNKQNNLRRNHPNYLRILIILINNEMKTYDILSSQ